MAYAESLASSKLTVLEKKMVPEIFERDHQEYLQQIAKRRIFLR